jgi:pyridoxal phosphate enzyme (YggS family)
MTLAVHHYDSLAILLLVDMADAQRAGGGLSERLGVVRARIEAAVHACSRTPEDITLIAISKTHPASAIREALELGLTDFGENRLQEAEPKIIEVGRHAARWHLVGHLQANKARRALRLFDVIHSLDSAELALRLDRLCSEEGRGELPVLIQVDLGREETKSGIDEGRFPELVGTLDKCSHLRLTGLMTLPPFFENPEEARPFFSRLRELRDELARQGRFRNGKGELSMGMTHDFEVAIEEGATMVRVGTAIFGERLPRT